MKRSFAASTLLLLIALAIVACASGRGDESVTQERFGVRMAKMNLWREAMFRFKRTVDMKPDDAMAHNNLAVAYEANGDFEAAAREYREAIRLDKSNQYIQKNYSRYVEFTSRNKKRQQRRDTTQPAETTATSTAPPTPTTTTTTTTTSTAEPTPVEPTSTAPLPPPPTTTAPPTDTSTPPGGLS